MRTDADILDETDRLDQSRQPTQTAIPTTPTPPRTTPLNLHRALAWNVTCPFVFKALVNHFIIPAINGYFAQIDILGISPLPPLQKLDTLTAFVLVALTSVRFAPMW